MSIPFVPELDWYKSESQLSSKSASPKTAASNLTAQQWAWEFLRRNRDYQKSWTLMSSLSPIQKKQIGYLIDKNHHTLLHDSLIEIEIVRTLNLQFFDQRQLSDFEGFEGDGSLGAYRDHISKFDDYDPSDFPPVSNQFLLSTYCLKRWADPCQSLETDPAAAAALWVYPQHQISGIEHAPWLRSTDDFDSANFRPVKVVNQSGKSGLKGIEAAGPLVKGVNGGIFLRSPTIWGLNYKVPVLKVEEVDIRFDLTLPIVFQLEQAKVALKNHHDLLNEAGFLLTLPKNADRNGKFREYLHILDRRNDGATPMDLTRETKSLKLKLASTVINKRTGRRVASKVLIDPLNKDAAHAKITEKARQNIHRATQLRDHGYKALAFL